MSGGDDEAALRARADAAVAEARRAPGPLTHRAAAYALDRLGDEHAAIRHYDAAWALGGFASPVDERRFLVGYGSTLRNVGRADDAVAVLADAVARHPDYPALTAFLALALLSAGQPHVAVATMLDAALGAAGPDAFDGYQRALGEYQQALLAAALAPPGA